MIDHAKLPNKALLDTNTLIRAWGDRPGDPREAECKELWDALVARKRDIYIAAPTIAEIMRVRGGKVPVTSGVTVVSFDRLAAELCAKHFPYAEIQSSANVGGVPVTYYKYDALIAACALRAKVDVLVTMDVGLSKKAEGAGLKTFTPANFQSAPPLAATAPAHAAVPASK